MEWMKELKEEKKKFEQIFSFDEFMQLLEKNSLSQLRSSSKYFTDLFDYFGKSEDGQFKLFQKEWASSPPIRGHANIQQKIYDQLKNFSEEGFNSKLLLLIGPNGSAKSSLVKKIMLAAQDYSNTTDGALYTFSWIFPIDSITKGSVGFQKIEKTYKNETYAHLDDQEITAILTSELKDHPLLLIPIEQRRRLIDQQLADHPKHLENIKKTFLYHGDLSQRNKSIFDALLKNYQGDFLQVLKHIRVERFFINRRYSSSAVTIEPQLHVDAQLQQITMDRRLSTLPPSLQSLNLFALNGEVILANRGILEFSDLFKRPLDTFKYLLTTMESKTVNLHGILMELDIFFIGTSNELHFSAFKQHPDFNSFKGRFHFIRTPYLNDYLKELQIYEEQLSIISPRCRYEPHALELLCLWSVMTRLRRPMITNYSDKALGEIVSKLNPLEKCLFIAKGTTPESLDTKEKQILRNGRHEVLQEFENDPLYEGKFGISPREIKQYIYEMAGQNDHIDAMDIIENLRELQDRKNEFDFLNISSQGDYHNYAKFLDILQEYLLDLYDGEIRESIGLIDNRSYEEYLEKYILHITAMIKGEKIKNHITGKFEVSDTYFITEFESNLTLKEKSTDFRSHMISRVGAYSLDYPGKKIVYSEIFPDIVKLLQESFRAEQKKVINQLTKQLVVILDEMKQSGDYLEQGHRLNKEVSQKFHTMMENLKTKYHYSEKGALKLLRNLISKRY
ncbi:MAG: hypothetical protein QE271_05535 [Bacteriovoracaceae bacterium]|nr:hypothetical protein [Bacteriovoracaceae bacterium]